MLGIRALPLRHAALVKTFRKRNSFAAEAFVGLSEKLRRPGSRGRCSAREELLARRADRPRFTDRGRRKFRLARHRRGDREAASGPLEPEFVVVNPRTAYGWLDQAVMSPARYELMKGLQERTGDQVGR
jgi:hypothetical protein